MKDDYAYRLNDVIKFKKRVGPWQTHSNHPHPLSQISLTGAIDISHDTRGHPTNLTATLKEDAIVFSSLVLSRKYFNKFPYTNGRPNDSLLADDEFSLFQRFPYPYLIDANTFGKGIGVTSTVGTSTLYEYSRPTSSDPWTQDSTNTKDVECTFSIVSMEGGGFVSPTNNTDCEIEMQIDMNAYVLSGSISPTFIRVPTVDVWADESDAIDDELQAIVDNLNAALSGSASFTSTAKIEFLPD